MKFHDPKGPQKPEPPDMMEVMDGVLQAAEFIGGQRKALVDQGFTEREAAQIVVTMHVSPAAQAWKEVGIQWGLPSPE